MIISNNGQTIGREFTRILAEILFELSQFGLNLEQLVHLDVESVVLCPDIIFLLNQLLLGAQWVFAAYWDVIVKV